MTSPAQHDPVVDIASLPVGHDLPDQLGPILDFMKSEIAQSSEMLRDLSGTVSAKLGLLADSEDQSAIIECVLHLSEAMQNEDRIQQRLNDICAALIFLERNLRHCCDPIYRLDLNRSLVNELRLAEMRAAFASRVGMSLPEGELPASKDTVRTGDLDLF